jgi:hypothetical protein
MKQEQAIHAIPYILAFLALLYLAWPHIYEGYVSYSRPWDTEQEHMTNADLEQKLEYNAATGDKNWEQFTEKEVPTDAVLAEILPGETFKPPAKPTPATLVPPSKSTPAAVIPPSNKHEVEPAIEKPPETIMNEKVNVRMMDPEVQKPLKSSKPPKEAEPVTRPPPPKVLKQTVQQKPELASNKTHKYMPQTGQPIWGPKAPEIDPNQPRPSDSGNGKHKSGIYPNIYGPDSLEAPGSKDMGGDSSNPPPADYVPAAEFPAGPLYPSPYLNDFSKMLKT